MRVLHTLTIGIVVAMAATSCSETPVEPKPDPEPLVVPARIDSFVNAVDLPMKQPAQVEFVRDGCYLIFVPYGPGFDCPHGCGYLALPGLATPTKIGWFDISEYDGSIDPSQIELYDVDEVDSLLFDRPFFADLERTSQSVYQHRFKRLLAQDLDTTRNALLIIVDELSTYINPRVAWLLLEENTRVRQDREILRKLSQLPVIDWDPYKMARERAQELLDALEAEVA